VPQLDYNGDMPLLKGETVGHYIISGPLGKGGMGEVYRALDTQLQREVAIKVLPAALARDPERLARFDREAKILAALNHPNIAVIYGLVESAGQRALVMELVPGDTLGTRIKQGAMPVAEAQHVAKQMAEALEAAHEKGVTHRDLKPGNVMITPAGLVKVLDFGLAAMAAPPATSIDPDNSPTLTMGMTQAGAIMGTAAYMSPEQAAGAQTDRRADIWSFGVVLYEMLTGKRLFDGGESISHTLADVLRAPIELSAIPAEGFRKLLKRCLDRSLRTRLQSIAEARIAIDEITEDGLQPSVAGGAGSLPYKLPWVSAGLAIVAAAVLAWTHFSEPEPERRSVRFQLSSPGKASINSFRLSPDGRYLAFVGIESGRARVWVRPIDSLEAQPLPGTDGVYPAGGDRISWSPDSTEILFTAQGKLKKVSVTGGPPQALAEVLSTARTSWGSAGVILIAPGVGVPIQRVPVAGGVPVPVTKLEGSSHTLPEFLPDGEHFLYVVLGPKPETNGIYVASIDASEAPVRLLPDTVPVFYAQATRPAETGHLLFRRENTLMARPFDPEKRMFTGELFPVADPVSQYSVSANGALAYGGGSGADRREMIWLDRAGKQIASAGPPAEYQNVRLSPDEKSLVFNRNEAGNDDVWVLDTTRGVPTRLTFDPGGDNLPIWSPDGLRVLWPSSRGGGYDLYLRPASGAGKDELLIKMGTPNGWATDWSRDGKFILFQKPSAKGGIRDLWIAPRKATGEADGAPFPYLESPFDKQNGVFSPDGHWIAYVSNESGRDEVYVQPFPLTSEKKQISTGGGIDPAWRKDGAELFYLAADSNLMAVPVRITASTIVPDAAEALFPMPGNQLRRNFAVSADGRRFLVGKPVSDGTASPPITVVLDWRAGLKK
jgi:serine/threonine protein kinase/Tol biopolymer transport system component